MKYFINAVQGGGYRKDKNRRRIMICLMIVSISLIAVFLSRTYAFFRKELELKTFHLTVGSLNYQLVLGSGENTTFSLPAGEYKTLEIELISENEIDSKYAFAYKKQENIEIKYFEKDKDSPFGTIEKQGKKQIKLRIHNTGDTAKNVEIFVKSGLLSNAIEFREDEVEIVLKMPPEYIEDALNGCDPVLSDNLIPVTIENDGTVHKADINEKWYSYTNKEWANAVVLENVGVSYENGEVIPETNIESYFVWVPRYKYKIFNDTVYTGLTEIEDKVQQIEIAFENQGVPLSTGTKKDEWLTHPAFTSFESNGFWVGKFESGYKGATSIETAQVNSSDSTKLQIKPDVYSWRSISVGNIFKASYDYLRSDESHMMKNMEWGAVAYLQHSKYGSMANVRINNHASYKTGYASVKAPTIGYNNGTSSPENLVGTTSDVTLPYHTSTGYTASTTGNITGIYDMAGGAWEYVMAYNLSFGLSGGESSIVDIYPDFFTNASWERYYDKYNNQGTEIDYQFGILGDATREMGPFGDIVDNGVTRHRTSWYSGFAYSISITAPWFTRGGSYPYGIFSNIFAFSDIVGAAASHISFRVILTP